MPVSVQRAISPTSLRQAYPPPVADDDLKQAPPPPARRPYHNGCAHLLTVLTPLVIGELIKDPEKRWRWIRIGSVVSALVGEMWQHRIAEARQRDDERSGGWARGEGRSKT